MQHATNAPSAHAFPIACFVLAQANDSPVPAPKKYTHQALEGMPNYGQMLIQMLLALSAIVVVLLVAAKLLPKLFGKRIGVAAGCGSRGRAGAAPVIDIIESRRLDPRTTIHLVKVADRYLLIGTTGDRVRTLAGGELDSAAVEAALQNAEAGGGRENTHARAESSASFSDVLKHADAPRSEQA